MRALAHSVNTQSPALTALSLFVVAELDSLSRVHDSFLSVAQYHHAETAFLVCDDKNIEGYCRVPSCFCNKHPFSLSLSLSCEMYLASCLSWFDDNDNKWSRRSCRKKRGLELFQRVFFFSSPFLDVLLFFSPTACILYRVFVIYRHEG